MNKEGQREAFLHKISEDKYDQTTRLIFADWLDENDYPEDANKQREWTPEWQKSEDWLTDFAERCTEGYELDEDYKKCTLEQLVKVINCYLEDGSSSVMSGLGFAAQDLYDEEREAFWYHWEEYTKATVDETYRTSEPFRCGC